MKWKANQRMGFFGFTMTRTAAGIEAVPRWEVVVDLEAIAEVEDVLAAWWASVSWPGVPPLSGGVLDAWPNRLREGLAICRQEWAAVMAHMRWSAKGAKRNG